MFQDQALYHLFRQQFIHSKITVYITCIYASMCIHSLPVGLGVLSVLI